MRTTPTARLTAALVTTVAAGLLLAGCADPDPSTDTPSAAPTSTSASPSADASADATADPGVVVDVTLTADGPTPQGDRVEVKVGEPITLSVTAEVADEVHVHSDPEVSIDVEAGDETSKTFTIDRPGQVAVESHASHAVIVQLVVRP